MQKKVWLVTILLPLLVLGIPFINTSVETESLTAVNWLSLPGTLYEFINYTLRIDFDFTNSSLLNYTILTQGVMIRNVQNPAGCFWNSTTIICNSNENPKIDAQVLEVGGNTAFTWDIRTNDAESGAQQWNLSFTATNDALAPHVTVVEPTNYKFIRNQSTIITVTFSEQESGFKDGNVSYRDNTIFDNDIRGSQVADIIASSCSGSVCNFTLNPTTQMGLAAGKYYFDSFITLQDFAGNVNDSYLYHLYVDTQAPAVGLNMPAPGFATNAGSYNFTYSMSDNSFATIGVGSFSPSVTCTLYLQNDTIFNLGSQLQGGNTSDSGMVTNLSSFQDGVYSWYVSCVDGAGWEGSSATRTITKDTTGPQFILLAPANGSVIAAGWLLNVSYSDTLTGVDSIWATVDGVSTSLLGSGAGVVSANSTGWAAGSRNLVIYANDTLGNLNQASYVFVVDAAVPVITLLSPSNGSYNNDVFTMSATDDHSTSFSCSLVLNGTTAQTKTVTGGVATNFTSSMTEGSYSWEMRCTDGVGNIGMSESRTVTIDRTAPVVMLDSPANNTNHPSGVAAFTVVQESPSDNCTVYVDGVVLGSPISFRNEPHYWNASCMDLAGNVGWSAETRTFYQDNMTPEVTSVTSASITTSSFLVSWTTNETANNSIFYGVNDSSLTSSVSGLVRNTTPAIIISSLEAGTRYFYKAQSCDQWNNCANSSTYNATTTSNPPSAPSGGGGGGGGGGPKKQCEDGKDNDGDNAVDLEDAGCSDANDNDETNPPAAAECNPLWRCTDWSSCGVEGTQTRVCQDWHLCGSTAGKPEESRSCSVPLQEIVETFEEDVEEKSEDQGNVLTGAVTNFVNGVKDNGLGILIIALIALIIGVAAWKKDTLFSSYQNLKSLKQQRQQKQETVQEKLKKEGVLK